jgi:hypothetical protein
LPRNTGRSSKSVLPLIAQVTMTVTKASHVPVMSVCEFFRADKALLPDELDFRKQSIIVASIRIE